MRAGASGRSTVGVQIQQLAYFVAVARHRHFTRAAADLHVAQPSISQQIRKLEAELGTKLFHRARRGVALTPAGEILLPWAQRVFADLEQARAEIEDLAGLRRGRLAVGAPPSVTTRLLPPALGEFHARHPGVALTLREAGSVDLVRLLGQGELDLAVIILPVGDPSLEFVPILREELVLAVRPDDPLSRAGTLEMADLRNVPFVMFREGYDLREATFAACRRAGFEPTVSLHGGEMDSVLRFVAAGLGVAIVPRMVIEPGGPVEAVPIARPTLKRVLALANRRDRPLSRAAREFASLLRGLVATISRDDADEAHLRRVRKAPLGGSR